MIRTNKTFVLSDETVNTYGFKVITSGIDLRKFLKNPVMLRNHEGEAIGFWENIRIEGNKLLADPVFSNTIPLGIETAQKVKEGTLRAASIGIEEAVFTYDSKYKDVNAEKGAVINCVLYEASIVELPSNENAIALLDNRGGRITGEYCISEYIHLNLRTNKGKFKMTKETLSLLNLTEDADANDVHNAIVKLLTKQQRLEQTNDQLTDQRNKEVIEGAISLGKISFKQADQYKLLLKKDFENTFKLLQTIEPKVAIKKEISISQLIKRSSNINTESKSNTDESEPPKDKKDWNLNDYRRHSPKELLKDKELYQRLVEQESNKHSL